MFCCQSKAGAATDYVRGEDVLDIWFDSGASWAAVLEGTSESFSHVSPVMQISLGPNRSTSSCFSCKTRLNSPARLSGCQFSRCPHSSAYFFISLIGDKAPYTCFT